MSCHRKYFFEFVLGWKLEGSNVHLEFGIAVHHAMEHLLLNGYSSKSMMEAYDLFEKHYRKHFTIEADIGNAPKTPGNFLTALPEYILKYKEDKFEVLHTEVSGKILIGPERYLHFRQDSIIRNELGICSFEHETGSNFNSKWANQWRQKIQVGAYAHVCYCLYGNVEEIFGVIINGMFIKNPPTRKNSPVTHFERVPIRKTSIHMEDWYHTVNYWYDRIQESFDLLDATSIDDPVMIAFPKNSESCDKYFGCPYLEYCNAWSNPLQRCEKIPSEFTQFYWNPTEVESKEVIEV